MLTPKQEAFCLAYIRCGNGLQAYREAGYSPRMSDKSATEAASRMLRDAKVVARIEELRKPVAAEAGITLENHLRDLEILRNQAVNDQKWSAAIQAEIARGRASGLYVERTELTGRDGAPVQVAQMTPGEFESVARKVADEI